MSHAKLITIYTEAALESTLIREIERAGVTGYTISNARGKGSHGRRTGAWEASANIRIEIICNTELSTQLINNLTDKYYDNYAMVTFTSDITVSRPQKFDIP